MGPPTDPPVIQPELSPADKFLREAFIQWLKEHQKDHAPELFAMGTPAVHLV
jgi:hypothetical protein